MGRGSALRTSRMSIKSPDCHKATDGSPEQSRLTPNCSTLSLDWILPHFEVVLDKCFSETFGDEVCYLMFALKAETVTGTDGLREICLSFFFLSVES